MAGVACLGKAADADEWCDSGLGSLGPDAAAPGGPGLGAELGPGLSWAPLVFGYVTEDGDTALHLAVIHQHEPFLDFLLGFAAGTEYLDLQNDLGQTALHLAAILEEASAVEKLYAAGASLLVAERGGHTALHLACRVGAHACARVLLQPRPRRPRGAPKTYLAQGSDHTPDTDHTPIALYSDPDVEKEEDESEEDWTLQLEAENYEGHTPLHVAVIHKDAEMVRLLQEAGADLNKPEPTCGRSPLHLAVEAQAADVLELLLKAGADPAVRMYGGRTPLGISSLIWFMTTTLIDNKDEPREKYLLIFGVLISVLIQEMFRFAYYKLLKKASEGLKTINPYEEAPSMRLLAYVSGLGFGIMSGIFSFVNTLSDSLGPGTVGIHGDPPQFFLNSAFMTLVITLLHVFWGIVFFDGCAKKKWYTLLVVVLSHLLVSALTFISPHYGLNLVLAYIIMVLTGVWAFFVSGGSCRSLKLCLLCQDKDFLLFNQRAR